MVLARLSVAKMPSMHFMQAGANHARGAAPLHTPLGVQILCNNGNAGLLHTGPLDFGSVREPQAATCADSIMPVL